MLVVGLFILTFIAQNFVIPSGSMENTLLVGDHLVVDRITLAPPAKWMPLVHYREPKRDDVVVFIKPVAEPEPDAEGKPQYFFLVKRLIGVPGDHIHLRDGIVILNGVAQCATSRPADHAGQLPGISRRISLCAALSATGGATEDMGCRFSESRGRWRILWCLRPCTS